MRKIFLPFFLIIYAYPTYSQSKGVYGLGYKTCADFFTEIQSQPIGSSYQFKNSEGTVFYHIKTRYLE
jgi:hypothetical protein